VKDCWQRLNKNSLLLLQKGETMTLAGAIIMLLSVGSVLALTTFCVVRVLSLPPVELEDIKGPLEIDTKDTNGD
jgi:hypothetical protein